MNTNIYYHNIKTILTESLILSIAAYLNILYDPFLTDLSIKLKKYKTLVCFTTNLSCRDHVSQHVKVVYNLNMAQRQYVGMCCLVYKLIHFYEPSYSPAMLRLCIRKILFI